MVYVGILRTLVARVRLRKSSRGGSKLRSVKALDFLLEVDITEIGEVQESGWVYVKKKRGSRAICTTSQFALLLGQMWNGAYQRELPCFKGFPGTKTHLRVHSCIRQERAWRRGCRHDDDDEASIGQRFDAWNLSPVATKTC